MGKTILFIIDPEHYFDSIVKIFRTFVKGRRVVYVTTNKPYSHMAEMFRKEKVNSSNVFFLDCISRQVGERGEEPENCVYIDSPQNLTAISIAISQAVEHLTGEKILFLDSLSTLLIYHDANTIGRFSNFLVNKMRLCGVDTVMLALEADMGKEVLKKIESIADEVKRS